MNAFVAFLKHDEVARVTADDVLGFKNHRLATINPRTGKAISAKTVRDSDLTALRAIFEWAVANRRMASNPVKEVQLRLGADARPERTPGDVSSEREGSCGGGRQSGPESRISKPARRPLRGWAAVRGGSGRPADDGVS
jgi:hypothetical protein